MSNRASPTASLLIAYFFSSRSRHTRFDCDWSSDVCSSDLVSASPLIPGITDREGDLEAVAAAGKEDRKSTRLNSSHSQISYAVFCLKKKTKSPSRTGHGLS